MFKKYPTVRVFPFGFTWWKVLADIAVCHGTEYGIRNRMQAHVRIRMSGQTAVMGYLHATEKNGLTVHEGMDVEAVANSNVHPAPQHRLGSREVLFAGDFEVALVTRHQ